MVIAKLDRLSRDAHLLLGLEKADVGFVAAAIPHANRLTAGIMAMVADEERGADQGRGCGSKEAWLEAGAGIVLLAKVAARHRLRVPAITQPIPPLFSTSWARWHNFMERHREGIQQPEHSHCSRWK